MTNFIETTIKGSNTIIVIYLYICHINVGYINIDTTTLSLYGEYPEAANQGEDEDQASIPRPERGYAKSKRHDLKQMVLLLATTGASNFPIWMEPHSGNASDQKTMPHAAMNVKSSARG